MCIYKPRQNKTFWEKALTSLLEKYFLLQFQIFLFPVKSQRLWQRDAALQTFAIPTSLAWTSLIARAVWSIRSSRSTVVRDAPNEDERDANKSRI